MSAGWSWRDDPRRWDHGMAASRHSTDYRHLVLTLLQNPPDTPKGTSSAVESFVKAKGWRGVADMGAEGVLLCGLDALESDRDVVVVPDECAEVTPELAMHLRVEVAEQIERARGLPSHEAFGEAGTVVELAEDALARLRDSLPQAIRDTGFTVAGPQGVPGSSFRQGARRELANLPTALPVITGWVRETVTRADDTQAVLYLAARLLQEVFAELARRACRAMGEHVTAYFLVTAPLDRRRVGELKRDLLWERAQTGVERPFRL